MLERKKATYVDSDIIIKYLNDQESAQINWDENIVFISKWPGSVSVMSLEIPSTLLFWNSCAEQLKDCIGEETLQMVLI